MVIFRKELNSAIQTFGKDAQLNVAIEEFAELTKEICKHKRGKQNLRSIIEEVADCYIMLEQILIIFEIGSTPIIDAIDRKLDRLHKLVSEAHNNECSK